MECDQDTLKQMKKEMVGSGEGILRQIIGDSDARESGRKREVGESYVDDEKG